MHQETSTQHCSTTLVIANNQDILQLVTAILKLNNTRILSVTDEDEGFALARAESPDVIILLAGKDEDRSDFSLRVREDDTLAGTPIVVLTTSGNSRTYTRFFADGCDHVLPVPFKCKALLEAIHNARKRNHPKAESAIRVLYRSGQAGFVSPTELNALLSGKELLCFQRKSGIASIGLDPVRCFVRANYKGPERRNSMHCNTAT